MTAEDRIELFDRSAASYDRAIERAGFPFEGYAEVLETIVRHAAVEPSQRVLDVGIGTGNLAARIAVPECAIWGIDFSGEMLSRAQAQLPKAHLVQADLRDGWPHTLPQRFDRIVSAYVFHELPDEAKLRLIIRLAAHLERDGRIVLGDIAFPDSAVRASSHRAWAAAWDEDEYYWAASAIQPALEASGFDVEYTQVSFCGGVFSLRFAEIR